VTEYITGSNVSCHFLLIRLWMWMTHVKQSSSYLLLSSIWLTNTCCRLQKSPRDFKNTWRRSCLDGDCMPPADLAPTVSMITTDLKEAAKLWAKYKYFHILVIGRANAGKMMLLKWVCNSKEDPVYSKVRYLLHLLPHSHHPFTNRLTWPQR
jgi:hypothetical protein